MKKIFLSLTVLSLAACHDSGTEPDNSPNLRTLSAAEVQISTSTNDFAFNLFKEVQSADPEANTFISPLSVSTALAMTLNGASEETQQSILQTIDFGDLTAAEVNQGYKDLTELLLSMDKKVTLEIANSVWYRNTLTISPPFASTVQQYYDGTVQGLNFSDPGATNVINQWVKDKTNDHIKNLVETIQEEDVMFLINAIYFKGDWAYQFDKSKTYSHPFTREDGSSTSVQMMSSSKVSMKAYVTEMFRLFDIPYGNEQFRFTILLPNGSHKLTEIAAEVNAEKLNTWLAQANGVTGKLELPKFKMEWKKDLKETLKTMGMHMTGFPRFFENLNNELEVSAVVQKTFIEVNETGTKAAAATSVGIIMISLSQAIIDRPFVFMIRENHSGAILFMGQLTDPAALTDY